MPDEVGGILQDAQDDIQLLDSNWQVCSQSVPSGQQVDATSEISFAAVKLSESCP
jgi:hypothetical protein